MRRLRLIIVGALLVALVIGPFVVELALDRPIYFYVTHRDQERVSMNSPSGKYRLHGILVSHHSDVYIARNWWLTPKQAVSWRLYSQFTRTYPGGAYRFGPQNGPLVWSRNERYLAATRDGWFDMVCDLDSGERREFVPASRKRGWSTVDELKEKDRELVAEWKKFHAEVQQLLDSDGGAVPQP